MFFIRAYNSRDGSISGEARSSESSIEGSRSNLNDANALWCLNAKWSECVALIERQKWMTQNYSFWFSETRGGKWGDIGFNLLLISFSFLSRCDNLTTSTTNLLWQLGTSSWSTYTSQQWQQHLSQSVSQTDFSWALLTLRRRQEDCKQKDSSVLSRRQKSSPHACLIITALKSFEWTICRFRIFISLLEEGKLPWPKEKEKRAL